MPSCFGLYVRGGYSAIRFVYLLAPDYVRILEETLVSGKV